MEEIMAARGPILLGHIWRTRPLAFPAVLIQTAAGLMSPFVLAYNLGWHTAATGIPPTLYPIALYLIACAYGLLYRCQRNDGLWKWAIIGTFFYIAFSPLLVWARRSACPRHILGNARWYRGAPG